MEIKYGVTGKDRKALVMAIAEIMEVEQLIAELAIRGFVSEQEEPERVMPESKYLISG